MVVDEWTAWAITLVRLESTEAEGWFVALTSAYDAAVAGEADWDSFCGQFVQEAERASVDASLVTEFLRSLANNGQGLELVGRVAQERDQLPSLYFELRAAWDEQPEEVRPFGWVATEQRDQLTAAWGSGWAEQVAPLLDQRWGEGWQEHPADHKTAWLRDLLTELTASPAEPTVPVNPASTSGAADPLPAEQLSSALREAMSQVPGAANLSESDLAEVWARVEQRMRNEVAS